MKRQFFVVGNCKGFWGCILDQLIAGQKRETLPLTPISTYELLSLFRVDIQFTKIDGLITSKNQPEQWRTISLLWCCCAANELEQVKFKHSTFGSNFFVLKLKGKKSESIPVINDPNTSMLYVSSAWVAKFSALVIYKYIHVYPLYIYTLICALSAKLSGARTAFVSQGTMASAGWYHTVLLRSDGNAVACGENSYRQCRLPPLDEGISYGQVSAGQSHTVLLRSDGQAVACGSNSSGECNIPPLDGGLSYSQVSAGGSHTVLLRSDGQAVACGSNSEGQCSIPPLDEGISYGQVSAGELHTVLLRSDGQAVACGSNSSRQCNIPPLDEGLSYSRVSAGFYHTVLLRSDGEAVACGSNSNGKCSIPPLDEGLSYSQVSAGVYHTVLLRSDGQAVACGSFSSGQCSIPPLDEGLSYSQVSAGGYHTVLLRSDGQAVACGWNSNGQCSIPSLQFWRDWLPFGFASPSYRYICDSTTCAMPGKDRVVQVDFLLEGDAGVILTCVGLDGLEVLRLKAKKSDRTVDVCMRVARELNANVENLRMVLPDARLLATICKENPFATLSDVISVWAKMASILWLRMGERSAKTNVEFHPHVIPQ